MSQGNLQNIPPLRSVPVFRAGARVGDFIPPALALILVLLMAIFLLVPIGMAISSAFENRDGRFSLEWFAMVSGSKLMLDQMLRSVLLACATTAACLALALPLAVLRARTSFFGQGLLGLLLLVPMILPPFVGAMSMRRLLCQFGSFNLLLEKIGLLDFSCSLPPDWLGGGLAGVVVLQALHLFPILYLNASAALANIDPAYPQAARNLGAGPWRTFFAVTLPLMRPGLFAGATIIFIWSLTDIGTPLIMGYEQLTAVTIFKELGRGNFEWTYSLVFIMLSGSVTLYVLGKFIFGRAHAAESSKATVSADVRRLGAAGTLGAWLMFSVVILLAVLPHVGVVLMAFSDQWVNTVVPSQFTLKHITFVLSDERTYSSIVNSLKYAAGSTTIDIVLGGLAAWLIVRCRVRGRGLLDGLMMLPLAVPGLILAAGYVALTNWHPPSWFPPWLSLEAIGPTKNPTWLLIIAYSVRRIPFVVRGVSAGLEQVPVSLEEAARNLGASQAGAAWRITVPLVAANIIAAGVLTFAFAVLEVSDSLILAQTEQYYPITKQIYNLAASTGFPQTANQAAALGVYGMALLAGTMAIASALLGKRLGAIFRA